MFIMAIASYRYIEKPLRKDQWFGKRWQTLVVSGGIIVTLFAGIVALGKPLKGKLFIGNPYNKWNMRNYRETKITHNPLLPTIYLIGDSHAGHYGSVMTHLAEKKEFNFIMHPGGEGLKLLNKDVEEYVLAPLREYKNNFKKGDVIIFSAKITKYHNHMQDWTKLYQTFLQQTQNIGIKFILISPTPTFSQQIKGHTCQEEWYRPKWALSKICFAEVKKSKWFTTYSMNISKIEKFLLANPKVSYFDAFSILCPNPYCKNRDHLSLMYKDGSHLTSYGAMKLSNSLETFILSK